MGKGLIEEIIAFYKRFKIYEEYSNDIIYEHIKPSIKLNQFKIFYDSDIYGFINWAYLNDVQKNKFIYHAIIDQGNWNCGNNLCFANFVSSKNIRDMINWCKEYFGNELKYDNAVWIKAFRNNKIMRVRNKWQK
tara:strand:- start:1575 stop:1976 length:402 start_codon:yes stop_codon:yes gene_type:complete